MLPRVLCKFLEDETFWKILKCFEKSWNILKNLEIFWKILKHFEKNLETFWKKSWNILKKILKHFENLERFWNSNKRAVDHIEPTDIHLRAGRWCQRLAIEVNYNCIQCVSLLFLLKDSYSIRPNSFHFYFFELN